MSVTTDAVVVGRNEGERLVACLRAMAGKVRQIVYVDSGSTDLSVRTAADLDARVITLDMSRPFSAARGRNAGWREVMANPPDYIQFMDGDCIVAVDWIHRATAFLEANPEVAAVCGRRRERFPEASIYNRLCDWEWDTPIGEARSCGGDALIRFSAIAAINGYREDVIAAEDDEMCQRLRKAGWKIWRIDAEMCAHDAAMTRFGQFWKRAVRAGHGFAQVGALHPGHFAAERRRAVVWGGVLPVLALIALWYAPAILVVIVGLYALSYARVFRRFLAAGMSRTQSLKAAGLLTLSKVCNLQGMATYYRRRLSGSAARIIEYK